MDTSVSYVSHGTLGWSKEKDPSKSTHVVISREFYSALDGQRLTIENLKRDINWYENERRQYQPTIDKLKREVSQLEDEMENLVRSANSSQYGEAEAVKMNEELYRICKERANAERGLRPKKEHSGYCVLRSKQMERRYGDYIGEMWETTVQTPIAVEWEYADAFRLVMKELFGSAPETINDETKPVYHKCLGRMKKCGITHMAKPKEKDWYFGLIFYSGRKDPDNAYSEKIQTGRNVDIAYDFYMQQDFQSGLWNLVFSHLHPLKSVPADMLPASRTDKKKGSQKAKKGVAE